MDKMEDVSLMPYGRHKGKQMKDVPSGYLLWLFGDLRRKTENITRQDVLIFAYILDNLGALRKDKKEYDSNKKEKKGLIVETKSGLRGKVYYNEEQINGKTCVRLKDGKLLCDPLSLVVKGFFD